MTEAISQGHAGPTGTPTNGTSRSATKPEPIEINVVVDNGSRPTLISAFQPAWQAAANRTARKTKFSIAPWVRPWLRPAPKVSGRRADIAAAARHRRRAPLRHANPNADRRENSAPWKPGRPHHLQRSALGLACRK